MIGAFLLLAAAADTRPVLVGGDRVADACGSQSRVVGLDPRGDNFLAVKAAPSLKARRLDRLGPGRLVHVCEEAGGWVGIVYGPDGCGVTTPIARRRAYHGPCRSGWVAARYLEPVAG